METPASLDQGQPNDMIPPIAPPGEHGGPVAPLAAVLQVIPASDRPQIRQKILNCVFGQAYGDSLGLATEFMTREQVLQYYGEADITHDMIIVDNHRDTWAKGDWTDDTDMMICCMRDLVQNQGRIVPVTLAAKFHNWYWHGYSELGDHAGSGVGNMVRSSLREKCFLTNPIKAAKIAWKLTMKHGGGNGGVMRTSIIGCLPDLNLVIDNARIACRVTHYSPDAQVSSIFISVLIHLLMYTELSEEACIDASFEHAIKAITCKYIARRMRLVIYRVNIDDIFTQNPKLPKIRATYKTMYCAVWALRQISQHQQTFHQVIQNIIQRGGDADTNAAVAGAVCGVRFLQNIEEVKRPMPYAAFLETEVNAFLNAFIVG
jgi:ADP-ribosylglycohydrolase